MKQHESTLKQQQVLLQKNSLTNSVCRRSFQTANS